MKIGPLIAVSLALGLTACGYERRDNGQPDQVGHDRTGAALTFGTISQVRGTRFFTIPIVRMEHGESGGSFTKSFAGNDERNRLIVDGTTGANRKVLPNTDFPIVNWIEPNAVASDSSAYSAEGSNERASGFYAAVVERPGRTEKDPHTYDLLLGRFEDGQQTWVARGLSGVESVWITQDGKLAVVAAIGERGIYRLYDPKSFQQLLETSLSL